MTTYKPSGVEWIGDIPSHWEIKRLKTEATYVVSNVDKVPAEDESPVKLCNYTDVYYNEYIHPRMDLMQTTATPDEIGKFGLHVNDLIITKDSEDWRDIAIPAMVIETAPDLVCGYHLAIIRPNATRLHGVYLLRLFQSCAVKQHFQLSASGVTRYGLPKSSIGEAIIPFPPLAEQKAIANFLDKKTDQIDKLIQKKRELIRKLTEKRSALITHAVTRGLNPKALTKPSSVEWIGDIPSHWEVKRLKNFSTINDDSLPETTENDFEILYVDISSVDASQGIIKKEKLSFDQAPSRARRVVRDGDTIVSTVRTYLKAIAYVKHPENNLIVSTGFAVVRPCLLHSGYQSYFLRSTYFISNVVSLSVGVSYPAINASTIGDIDILQPSITEQEAIADYLDQKTEQIDTLIKKTEIAIEILEEYRQALITNTVTGKLKIRSIT